MARLTIAGPRPVLVRPVVPKVPQVFPAIKPATVAPKPATLPVRLPEIFPAKSTVIELPAIKPATLPEKKPDVIVEEVKMIPALLPEKKDTMPGIGIFALPKDKQLEVAKKYEGNTFFKSLDKVGDQFIENTLGAATAAAVNKGGFTAVKESFKVAAPIAATVGGALLTAKPKKQTMAKSVIGNFVSDASKGIDWGGVLTGVFDKAVSALGGKDQEKSSQQPSTSPLQNIPTWVIVVVIALLFGKKLLRLLK